MRALILFLLVISAPGYAILPLPYPTDGSALRPGSDALISAIEGEKDPREIQAYQDLKLAGGTREMELPAFENQPDAIGYKTGETFQVPAELTKRVAFWKRIYTEFTTGQAVLHDAGYPDIIYGVVDISDLTGNESLSYRRRAKLVRKRLEAEKKKVEEKLRFLDENRGTPEKIPVDMFPIFTEFEKISEPDKFVRAIDRVRAQVGQRDRIVQGFLYGGRYFNELVKVFQARHLPVELTRLPLVESAFNLAARSKVGASGVWQFMRSTGKRFLRIDRAIDERNDPIMAAWAAADLLKGNFDALGSWPLAITAYNHGREGMQRAVRELGTTDLSEIIKRYQAASFGFASSNFYSEFLAILEVEREYRKHFGKLLVDSPIQFEEFNVGDDVSLDELAEACRLRSEELAALNPALTDWVTSGHGRVPRGYMLKVPPGKSVACKSGYQNIVKLSRRTPHPIRVVAHHSRARRLAGARRVKFVMHHRRSKRVARRT